MRTPEQQAFIDLLTRAVDSGRTLCVLVTVWADMPADTCAETIDLEAKGLRMQVFANTEDAEAITMALRDAGAHVLAMQLDGTPFNGAGAQVIRRVLGVKGPML